MNSSTGFKKRNLLRPASGVLNKEKQFLKVFDISQSEPVISSSIRQQVALIQEEINLLDKDKKIRQGETSLQKSYVSTFKKWLREAQLLSEKEEDDKKILTQMGVDSYQSGFRKLWKLISNLDLMVSKITELQIVQFLLYDQMFDEMSENSQKASSILSSISKGGYNAGSFQITQVILDRNKDVFSFTNEARKKGNFSVSQKSTNNETSELINQLKYQNSKLNALLEQITSEKTKQDQNRKNQGKKESEKKSDQKLKEITSSSTNITSSKDIFYKDLEEKYTEQLKFLTNQKNRAEESLSEIKIKLSSCETQLKIAEEELKKNEYKPSTKFSSGSYEEALAEEMEKMKKGFERKIAKLNEEYVSKEKQMRRKESEYKNENEKIKWEKSLLLKKFETVSSGK